MVKFDVSMIKFLEDDDFRVLTALEMALRNHDVAPTVLIERIAGLQHGGARRRLQSLLKAKIIHHETMMYDGYAMKYTAYDFLALRVFSKRGTVLGVGGRIGCGKESDIFLIEDSNHNQAVMKLQRLGRCSFRSVTRNRDYKGGLKKRRGASWFYLSRLAAQKEYAFMQMLHEEGFPVPKPIDCNRHAIVMEHVNATLLNHIEHLDRPQKVYERCLELIVRLAQSGLVHGDFNEFNLFVNNDMQVIMIDFPQMVSIDHPNAGELFDRDVRNLALFFERRFGLQTPYYPRLETDVERSGAALDRTVVASGAISKQQMRELEQMRSEQDGATRRREGDDDDDDDDDDEEDGEEGDEEEESGDDDVVAAAVAPADARAATASAPTPAPAPAPAPTAAPAFVSLAHLKAGVDFTEMLAAAAAAATAPAGSAGAAPTDETAGGGGDGDSSAGDDDDDAAPCAGPNAAPAAAGVAADVPSSRRSVIAPSVATTVAPQVMSAEAIRERVRKQLAGLDDIAFRRTMHRNSQKGKDKVRIKRQVKNAMHKQDDGFW
jgi:RIO kinase 2